ncbi:MAG: phosphate/phosphite/phosphonate ABC transporter substrate-binding protein [Acidimicrobiia bacterium]
MASYLVPGFPATLFEVLADRLGAELVLESCGSGPDPGHDPFRDGTYDLGWICAPSYVDLNRAPEPSVRLVGAAWVPDDPAAQGQPVYFSDLVAAPDCEADSLADLSGLRIGCNDHMSLSGNHALQIALRERGEDPGGFADLIFTGGHQTSLDLLLTGELDAAVIDSIVRIARARREPEVAALRVVERLGPWPVQALVARTDMAGAEVEALCGRLLAVAAEPEVERQLHAAGLLGFVTIGDDHFEPVRAALADQV